jgi:UPF0271 protein
MVLLLQRKKSIKNSQDIDFQVFYLRGGRKMKIIDSSAIINSEISFDEVVFSVPEIVYEIKDQKSRILLDSLIFSGKIKFLEPSKKSLNKIRRTAGKLGCFRRLSDVDIKVLALAYELEGVLITDDYTMQNIAKYLNIPFEGICRGTIKDIKNFKQKK